ncbi:MAG: pyridoxamine 5'-phosphate oxidase [Rhodospirillales bacterium]|nr:pyridoxamine 5'-phosphate oxidase [Rhodospirillales bacterium]MCB9995248.1 pyridoxamine 5'-phosphate oxidase [Rhodospirillales bacterium]
MSNPDPIKALETANDAPDQPLALFHQWFAEAEQSEPVDANAMSVATIDADGTPSVRILLLKALDDRGFVFYTNKQSRKGDALGANPLAALCFHWKSLGRQVRIEGTVEHVSDEEADSYFATRPEGSRIGAWASQQSRQLDSRSTLEKAVADRTAEYEGQTIPRPPHWGGYRVIPNRIEFWHEGQYRLHTRLIYTKQGGDWAKQMLFP